MKKATPFFLVICAAVFLFSGFMLVRELLTQKQDKDGFDELAALITPETAAPESTTPAPSPTEGTGDAEPGHTQEPAPPPARNLAPLFQRNPDCIGWIYIADTAVNYPVMHTPDDPEKYLHKNFDKEYSAAGVPFLEDACDISCTNLIVYGHNMKNGTMFADVTQYRKEEFFTSHPVIELETAQGATQYAVFAVAQVKNDDAWYTFHYGDESEYSARVTELKDRALYDTGITPQYGQQLLTLSTCYGATKSDRIIVIAAEIIP